MLLFVIQVENVFSRETIENRIDKETRETIRLECLMIVASNFYIPMPEVCVQTTAGIWKVLHLHISDWLQDSETLQDLFGYDPADVGNDTMDAGPPDHERVPATMDIFARNTSAQDP